MSLDSLPDLGVCVLERLARWCHRQRWTVVVGWLATLVFVAQWLGNFKSAGDGTAALNVQVGPTKKK